MKFLEATIVLNVHALAQSFCIVGIAEIFDKTWFVALVMAMMYNKGVVFVSSFLALFLHVLIAALFGYGISRMFHLSTLHFSAAALYMTFAVLYGIEWFTSSGNDVLAAGREEAQEAIGAEETGYGAVDGKDGKAKPPKRSWRSVFFQCFMAVFIAEWGDRTQIAMIGQHASQPIIPVVLGSAGAFALLTLSAVVVGMMLGKSTLSERMICMVSTMSFAVFSVLAIWDGIAARRAENHIVF